MYRAALKQLIYDLIELHWVLLLLSSVGYYCQRVIVFCGAYSRVFMDGAGANGCGRSDVMVFVMSFILLSGRCRVCEVSRSITISGLDSRSTVVYA